MTEKYITLLTKNFLEDKILELGNIKNVADDLKVNSGIIYRYCKKLNIPVRSCIHHKINDEFFKIDTEESLYVAGFLAADGCISKGKIEISLASKDRNILEKILEAMGSEHPIKNVTYFSKQLNKNYNCSRISIGNLKLIQDLADRFNITPAKSKTYQFPERLINHPLVNHFLRGLSDGDGSWGCYSGRVSFKMQGTKNLLEHYLLILNRECNLDREEKKILISPGCFNLDFGGNVICGKIAKFLYQDATIFLERKYIIADKN